ncbi:MAG TPA: fumarylacetoacetate hydrolase family protein [Streptosporangiaceae bacterium]|nr:fumarylacetoacetate hydrolase family protein [Streptosporangiaceae bacterium]
MAPLSVPFALGTFTEPGGPAGEFAGLIAGDRVLDLRNVLGTGYGGQPSVRDLLGDWAAALGRLGELAGAPGRWIPADELRAAPPVRPGQILQSGANYRQHVIDIIVSEKDSYRGRSAEQVRADAEQMMATRAAAGEPYLFAGLPSALCGARDDIVLPTEGTQHDWELELAVVIGRPARRVPAQTALEYVAGYLICDDITTRDLVYRPDLDRIGTDWLRAKNSPTFLPAGPFLVPAPQVPDPMDLRITLRHNGQLRQDASTSDMIFDIATLVSYASQRVPLSPGDLLLTGSPAGNGAHWGEFLQPGDVIEAEITGPAVQQTLGTQRNVCVKEFPA